jgi:D-amino-acid dehydrogenase
VKVAVVGGGAVGLSTAWALAEAGADVTVLERDRCGHGCTFGNTGWICPALSAPLPAPGVMLAALKGMWRPSSPILIRPFFGPGFLRWSWGFWRACAPARYQAGLEATLALGARAVPLFRELREAGVEFELYERGMLVAAITPHGLAEYEGMLGAARAAGYEGEIELLDGEGVRRLDPAVSDAVVGGIHAPAERYVRPESFARGLAAALRERGADVREGIAVNGLARRDGRWEVATVGEAVTADAVVVAAGAWSGRLLTGIVNVPLEAAKGYSVTARGEGTVPRHALYLAEAKVGCSSFGDSLRIAGIFDLTGIDSSLRRRRLANIVSGSTPYLRDWRPTDVELEWAGLRPYPPDGLPIVGAVPGQDGLFLATGHGRMGITLAPATGKAVATLVTEGRLADELRPFGVERFARARARAAA